MKRYAVQMMAFLFLITLLCSGQDKNADIGVSKELQDKIDKSIEKGVAWLKAQQQADGSFALEGGILNTNLPILDAVKLNLLAVNLPSK